MMRSMSTVELVDSLRGSFHGEHANFDSVSTDTRELQQGALFVALQGKRFNAENFLKEALSKRACAAVVQQQYNEIELPQLVVKDSLIALGQIAALNRRLFQGPVVGLTGSVGKTTCKEMLNSILQQVGSILATRGNLNNEIGVPLTLLEISEAADYAVIEMGAGKPGDIDYLTAMVRPNVALVTRVAPAHLEFFGSVESIAETKSEIYRYLDEDDVAVINLDDAVLASCIRGKQFHKTIGFSVENEQADVFASGLCADKRGELPCYSFVLHWQGQKYAVSLRVPGRHMVANALASAACALALNIEPDTIVSGLQQFDSVHQRMQSAVGVQHARVIDDTYNANPASMRAAIDVLVSQAAPRILVMGDMGELGETSASLHAEAGSYARQGGVEYLLATGDFSQHAVEAFGGNARHFANREALLAHCNSLLGELQQPATVLVKGSRAAGMEFIATQLQRPKGSN